MPRPCTRMKNIKCFVPLMASKTQKGKGLDGKREAIGGLNERKVNYFRSVDF